MGAENGHRGALMELFLFNQPDTNRLVSPPFLQHISQLSTRGAAGIGLFGQ